MNYFVFAYRNLKKKGVRSFLTLLGIFIGVLAVVSLITLGSAMKVAVTSQFGLGSTEVISVEAGGLSFGPPGSGVTNPLTVQDAEEISRLSSVEYAVGRNIETISLEYNDKLRVTSAYSVVEDYERETYEVLDDVEIFQGRLLKNSESGKVFIGYNLYESSNNGFEKSLTPGKSILINGESFEVVGVLKKKGSFIYDGTVFMYENDLKGIGGYGDNVDTIQVKVRNKDLVDDAQESIEKLLRNRRNVDVGEEDFQVSTPESTLNTINGVLGGIQAFIVIIALISVVVGSFGIVNTMGTSVLERRKEIGIMKAVGARNEQIFAQFFVESGFLGLMGGLLGILFGIAIGYVGTYGINLWLGSSISPTINLGLIFFTLLGSFLIGAIAGIAPAMQAARQSPVEALRG